MMLYCYSWNCFFVIALLLFIRKTKSAGNQFSSSRYALLLFMELLYYLVDHSWCMLALLYYLCYQFMMFALLPCGPCFIPFLFFLKSCKSQMSTEISTQPQKKGKAKEKVIKDSDEINVTAKWDDRKHFIWLNICLEESRVGNKKSATLDSEGYNNLIRKFEERTGCRYTRSQFKNHWDNVRKEWQYWTALKGETRKGFDGETPEQDDEWWTLFAKV